MSNPSKRMAVFLDGTWNDPDNNTNVWRSKLLLSPKDNAGKPQLGYYDTGVGTRWYNRLRGGALAKGLSKNVREAYQWLMEHYEADDEVYIFGFSRGAYTARSLAGMIAKCGLLRPTSPMPVIQVFERYRKGREARPLYKLEYMKRHKENTFSQEEQWLLAHSTRIPIKFIGVWDTVGALGLPFGRIPGLSRKTLYFHNTRLSTIFDYACHALAIDEHRKPYRPSLWTKFIPRNDDENEESPESEKKYPHVEQRWFVGAHANVGGGYRNNPLAQVPLDWILQKASKAGLVFRQMIILNGDEHLAPVIDSYGQFLGGAYKYIKLGRRHYRTIGWPREPKDKGDVETVNETIDASVFDRWRNDSTYRPANLLAWAASRKLDPGELHDTTPVGEPVTDLLC